MFKDEQHDYRVDSMDRDESSWDRGSGSSGRPRQGWIVLGFEWSARMLSSRNRSTERGEPCIAATSPFAIRPISAEGFELVTGL